MFEGAPAATFQRAPGLLNSYKSWLSSQTLTPNTMRVYHSRVKQFMHFVELRDERTLDTLTAFESAINQYVAFLKRTGQSAQSLNANSNALNNFATYLGYPRQSMPREKAKAVSPEYLDLDEQMRFLHCSERQTSARDRALALVLFYTGLRIGDCALLNLKDVSASGEMIFLGNAVIRLNRQTSQAVCEWIEERRSIEREPEELALWLTSSGHRLSIQGIAFVIKRIGWQANLSVSVETLRRSFLSNQAILLDKKAYAKHFGGYVSASSLRRYAI